MEDVLDVYHRPPDPKRPLICIDEASKQLLSDSREPIPMAPGQPLREDYEYVRNGTCSFFMTFAPLLCQRHVYVTGRRTAVDFASVVRHLVDVQYPKAEQLLISH